MLYFSSWCTRSMGKCISTASQTLGPRQNLGLIPLKITEWYDDTNPSPLAGATKISHLHGIDQLPPKHAWLTAHWSDEDFVQPIQNNWHVWPVGLSPCTMTQRLSVWTFQHFPLKTWWLELTYSVHPRTIQDETTNLWRVHVLDDHPNSWVVSHHGFSWTPWLRAAPFEKG